MTKPPDHLKTTTAKIATLLASILLPLVLGFTQAQAPILNESQRTLLMLQGEIQVFQTFVGGDIGDLRQADRNGTLEQADVDAALVRLEELIEHAESLRDEADIVMGPPGTILGYKSAEPWGTANLYAAAAMYVDYVIDGYQWKLEEVFEGQKDLLDIHRLSNEVEYTDRALMYRLLGNQSYRLDQLEAE